jgi:hypothetical protein
VSPGRAGDVEFALEALGFDRTFIDDLGMRLTGAATVALPAEIATLRVDVRRRAGLAWQMRFASPADETAAPFAVAADRAWRELTTALALTVLHDLHAGEPGPQQAAAVLDAADVLLAAALGSSTTSLGDAPEEAVPPDGSLLAHALELFAQACAAELAAGAGPARLASFAGAVRRYAVTAVSADDHHRMAAHLMLAVLFDHVDTPAETQRLAEIVAALPSIHTLPPFEDPPHWVEASPTARNLRVFLETWRTTGDSYDTVTVALDEIENLCGACLAPGGCEDTTGGCARRDDDAPYCTALLVTYLRALQSLWTVVRSPESLDHAVTVAEGRSRGGRRDMSDVLLDLRCGRFAAYRRQDDREYLSRIFDRADYTALPTWVPGWLLADVSGTTEAGMASAAVVLRPAFGTLGLDADTVLNALFATLDDSKWRRHPRWRLPVWLDLARRCAEQGYPDAELDALEAHRELCDQLYREQDRSEVREVAVEARAAAGPLHAARLAQAGRFAEAVDRLEDEVRNDLRLTHAFDRTNLRPPCPLTADREELAEAETQLSAAPGEPGSTMALRRRVHLLRDRIAARSVPDPGPGPGSLDLVRGRASSLGCPVLYLWSSEVGGHLLAVTPETGPEPVRYFDLGPELSTGTLDLLIHDLADARSARDAAKAYEEILRECLSRGLGAALALAAPHGRAVLVPSGRWRAIPLHVAGEIDPTPGGPTQDATADGVRVPVLSYAASGVPTAAAPSTATLPDRPSVIMTDLAAGSMPDRAVAAIVDLECRLLEAHLGAQVTLLSGPAAAGQSLAGFLRSHLDCGVVHLSIHGSERAEDRRGGVPPGGPAADGGQAPGVPDFCTVLACTSAGADQEYLDEVVRMQQAMMLGGIPEVVLSRWPVGDLAAALFGSYFYQRVLEEGRPCWQAVAEARAWLRSLTDDDVIAYLDGQDVEERPQLSGGDQKTFGDLWGWGAFAHIQAW